MAELAVNLVSEEFVQEVRALKRAVGGNGFQPKVERPSTPPQVPDGIRVFNTSSTDTIRGYGIMAVTDCTTAVPNVLNVATPSTTFYRSYLVNGPVAIQPSGWGWAQKGPLVRVAYDTGTPANGEGWGPKPSQDTISAFYPETCVIQGIYDSTLKIALAIFKPTIDSGFAKANGTVANDASGAISIWTSTFGADITGMDPTAYNAGPAWASGDKLTWEFKNGKLSAVKLCTS